MALEQITFNIGAFNDSDAGGNNYFTNTVFEVKNQSDNTFATIYADSSGTTQIPQNGIDNISNERGECNFYIDDGDFYIEVASQKSNFKTRVRADRIILDGGGSVQNLADSLNFDTVDEATSYGGIDGLLGRRIYIKERSAWFEVVLSSSFSGSGEGMDELTSVANSDYGLKTYKIHKLSVYGAQDDIDETARIERMLSLISVLGGDCYIDKNVQFSSFTVPYRVRVYGLGSKVTTITCNSLTEDAVKLGFESGNEFNFFNGVSNLTIDATSSRRSSGAGRGLSIDNGTTNRVAFKCKCEDLIIQNQPSDGFYCVQPEECEFEIISQLNKGKGFSITAPELKGIANKFKFRALNNEDIPIDSVTNNSDFITPEALVQGDSPVYTGLLMSIGGNGNTINNPDVELNQSPSIANINLMTGIRVVGDNNQIISGFVGNCATSIDCRGRGTKIIKPKLNIFSTNVVGDLSGSIGIAVASGATFADIEIEPSTANDIETLVSDPSNNALVKSEGLINGLGRVITASTTWDPPTMAADGSQQTAFSVSSASLGDQVVVGHTGITAGLGTNGKVIISGYAVNGSVVVVVKNETGNAVDIPPGTLNVKLFK
jgi:hypothetical protein